MYSRCFPRDNKYIKLLGTRIPRLIPTCFFLTKHFVVYSIFFLETVQTVVSVAGLYYWFAASFGGKNIVTPFSFFDTQIVGSMVSLSVQLFFVYRIRVLSRLCEKRSLWLCIIIEVIICQVTSSPKFQNDLLTLPAALSYRRIRGIHSGHHCEPPLLHITEQLLFKFSMHQMRIGNKITNEFIVGPIDWYQKIFQIVKSSGKQNRLTPY